MQFIRGKHNGNLRISDDTEITGLVTGKVTVDEGAKLLLRGTLTSDLEVFGRAEIIGTVIGTVFNSGLLIVAGTVGAIVEEHGCTTNVLQAGTVRDR